MPEDKSNFQFAVGFFFILSVILYLPYFWIVLGISLWDFLINFDSYLKNNMIYFMFGFVYNFYFFTSILGIFIGILRKSHKTITNSIIPIFFFSGISSFIIMNDSNNFFINIVLLLYGLFLLWCFIVFTYQKYKNKNFCDDLITFPKGSIFKGSISTRLLQLFYRNKKKIFYTGDFILKENEDKKPTYYKDKFICPFCELFVKHKWKADVLANYQDKNEEIFSMSRCTNCNKSIIWSEKYREIIYPEIYTIPKPHKELDKNIKELYNEATMICKKSPRGAAALLRLALEKFLKQLNVPGRSLSQMIGNLIKKGVDKNIKNACDIVRIYGNYAVHAGEIDLNDNLEIVRGLFWLINKIAKIELTEKKEIESMFSSLPERKREGIFNRDQNIKRNE